MEEGRQLQIIATKALEVTIGVVKLIYKKQKPTLMRYILRQMDIVGTTLLTGGNGFIVR